MKELPKVFANPINKKINNNKVFSYGKLMEDRNSIDVREKIDKIFKNNDMIYSIDCIILLKTGQEKHTIIGKTDNNLVTKTQNTIPIKDIIDIDLA